MKNILLAVVGLNPQIITETLFALHQQQRRVDAIHIITTRLGKEQMNAHLLTPVKGKYYQYLNEYGINSGSIDFGHHNIHTIKNENGLETDEIWSEEHNEQLLKKCLELTFQFTANPETTVFFSIAGGRKTMSSCLTLAAQLYGRPQDRIYHVLLTSEFESNRDFFYPPKKSVPITLRDEKGQPFLKETRYASINLIPVPFVSIRDRISSDLLNKPMDPASLMLSLVKEEEYRLVVDLEACKLLYKNMEMDMMPARMALYAFFAFQKRQCSKEIKSCQGCYECYLHLQKIYECQDEITDIYRKISIFKELSEMSDSGILGLTAENFQSYKAKIRKDLEKGFGVIAMPELTIESIGQRPDTCYGIRIDKKRLRIIV